MRTSDGWKGKSCSPHLKEAADVVAHELPQDGKQQLVLAVHNVDAADVHQRQRQNLPCYANHLHVAPSCLHALWMQYPFLLEFSGSV